MLGRVKNCPACGSTDIHRSRASSLRERSRKLFSNERPHRCHACGWRGWGQTTPHHHAAATTADGWEAIDVDLVQLDGLAMQVAPGSEAAPGQRHDRGTAQRHSHRHRSATSTSRATASEFNRRVQLVLFVVLLLLGIVVVLRACGGSRPVEPTEPRQVGLAGQVSQVG